MREERAEGEPGSGPFGVDWQRALLGHPLHAEAFPACSVPTPGQPAGASAGLSGVSEECVTLDGSGGDSLEDIMFATEHKKYLAVSRI
jgi:hypothetical protein